MFLSKPTWWFPLNLFWNMALCQFCSDAGSLRFKSIFGPVFHANFFICQDSETGFKPYLRHTLLKFTVEWTDYWHFKLHCFFLRTGMSCLLVMQWLGSLCCWLCWVSGFRSSHFAESGYLKNYKFALNNPQSSYYRFRPYWHKNLYEIF